MGHRPGLNAWYRVAELRQGQMVLGYRFNTDLMIDFTWNDSAMIDKGVTHQVDAMPVAGPIFFYVNVEPWARYQMHCAGCNTTSKGYKIRHYGLIFWANEHRCEARVELNNTVHQKSGSMGTLAYNQFYGLPWNR